MDDVNWRILALLQEKRADLVQRDRKAGRADFDRGGERVRRLEDARVVRSYRIVPGDDELGYPIAAFVTVAVHYGGASQLLRLCTEMPEVIECHHVTGEDSYLLRVRATSVPHLEEWCSGSAVSANRARRSCCRRRSSTSRLRARAAKSGGPHRSARGPPS
jgi:Lrp/AsnC family leucine-responsive transcriptional regulator